ncbi:Mitochondrial transcription termination factor, mTERF [Handroanthus impetiginosus]|uniref:Mitochondrial transcription termination factor, mTERF n=1 Tax=Handroanthus impetiginosus TaxID=429701 RepID=A0A2G9FVI7_9LAMI|nr:Mitochondrial transcription termination factor, mTERF [Handroanthus impetiginosus]
MGLNFVHSHFEKNFKPMFNLLFKKQLTIVAASNVRGFRSPPRSPLIASLIIRLFSSNSEIPCDQRKSFTVSYLINSCGLSQEATNVASKKVTLKSPENADLLLTILKNHGLSDAHITKMVTISPNILLAHPEKTVLPKLQFLNSIGMPAPDLAQLIARTPGILRCSLRNRIIPFYECLKNLLKSDKKVITVFKRATAYFLLNPLQRMPHNVAVLKKYGVDESKISFLAVHNPQPLLARSDKLVKLLDKVTELGIDISKSIFIQAVKVLYSTTKSSWEAKRKTYHKWGWSESDISMAFSFHPVCMNLSEKKIMSEMDFFVNEMNCEAKAIARQPTVLFYSLKKRSMPRCRVVKLLMVKGLIKPSCSLASVLRMTDKTFLEKFVVKYHNVPRLLDVYRGNLNLRDLGFDSRELARVKLL